MRSCRAAPGAQLNVNGDSPHEVDSGRRRHGDAFRYCHGSRRGAGTGRCRLSGHAEARGRRDRSRPSHLPRARGNSSRGRSAHAALSGMAARKSRAARADRQVRRTLAQRRRQAGPMEAGFERCVRVPSRRAGRRHDARRGIPVPVAAGHGAGTRCDDARADQPAMEYCRSIRPATTRAASRSRRA